MMSLEVLIAVNEEIAAEAAAKNLRPHVPSRQANVARWKKFPFPNLGYYVPDGWEKVRTWFVDKTGHGYEWEPALTHKQFRGALQDYIEANPDHGYAIVEEGEFQLVIGAFKREPIANAA